MSDLDISASLAEIRHQLDRIEKLLLGDGQEGIVREVAKNTEFRRNFQHTQRLIFGSVAGAAVTALAGLIRALI